MTAETTFGGLTPQAWDRLAGEHFYSTSSWLRFCTAEAGTPGSAVVTRAGAEPTCAVPTRELGGLPAWSRYWWNNHLAESGLPQLARQGTLVGPAEGFQTHFLTPPGERPVPALGELIEELRRRDAAAGGAGERACVAMYVTTDGVRAVREVGVDVVPVLLDADAWIPIPAGGWPQWLEVLPSKRRRTVRREERDFQRAGYEIANIRLRDCVEELGVPAAATLQKYGHETTPETELVSLRRVVEWMGDAAQVAILTLGDSGPLGFCIYYAWQGTIFLRWAGFDYDRLVGAEEYFNLVYYHLVKSAPELGARWIHAGATAQAAKALRGAELRPLWLLDLTEGTPFSGAAEQVREHNARVLGQLADDPRTAPALVPEEDWKVFC